MRPGYYGIPRRTVGINLCWLPLTETGGRKIAEHFADLFGFGLFEFVIWAVQSLLASFIGERLIIKKSMQSL